MLLTGLLPPNGLTELAITPPAASTAVVPALAAKLLARLDGVLAILLALLAALVKLFAVLTPPVIT